MTGIQNKDCWVYILLLREDLHKQLQEYLVIHGQFKASSWFSAVGAVPQFIQSFKNFFHYKNWKRNNIPVNIHLKQRGISHTELPDCVI